MSKEYYVLIKEVNDKEVYVSKEAPSEVVPDLSDALPFFSFNHITIWRKCNPNVTDTIAVKVCIDHDNIEVTKIE